MLDHDMDGSICIHEIADEINFDYEKLDVTPSLVKVNSQSIHEDWKDILHQIDLDGDGMIDFNEFFTAGVDHVKVLSQENIDYIFDTFDVDKDGSISFMDFITILPSVLEKSEDKEIKKQVKKMKTMGQSADGPDLLTAEQRDKLRWQDLVDEVDNNNNGTISKAEFEKSLQEFITDCNDK